MAVLTDPERVLIWQRAIATLKRRGASSLTKVEWRQMVDDVDAWADANAASFNTGIRVAVRNKATATEKALALAYVCLQRAGEPLGGE